MSRHYTFVVVGGGIAGVTCVETLAFLDEQSSILLITSSDIVKAASSAIQVTKTLVQLNVEEIEAKRVFGKYKNVEIMTDVVTKLNYPERIIETSKNQRISFCKLCICTGGKPNVIFPNNRNVIGIRDTESVVDFQKRIKSARRIIIVGNGGIASEVVHEVKSVEKIWVVKDDYISKTFIDAGAGEFFRAALYNTEGGEESTVVKRLTFTTEAMSQEGSAIIPNPALGPDWHTQYDLTGAGENNVILEFKTEITNITDGTENWPVKVHLSNGKHYLVDFVISATGVSPNTEVFTIGNKDLKTAEDGGILVDWKMETSFPDVFAAGDVCTAGWEPADHWVQMRLWTQARQMGAYSAKSMVASLNKEELLQDFCFEIFSHVTKLFGYKVIMLGLFNAQKFTDNKYELLLRMTKGKEYVKLVLKDGKLQGALLIGETDLEEMCENLILNQIDLTPFGEDLLNPEIDIEDYFD